MAAFADAVDEAFRDGEPAAGDRPAGIDAAGNGS
jgi:hypothetical protein